MCHMEDENHMEKIFKSQDFYTSVLLKTLGFRLIRLERLFGNLVTFVFEDPQENAQETIDQYWDRKIICNARDLIETINELKTRIYSKK